MKLTQLNEGDDPVFFCDFCGKNHAYVDKIVESGPRSKGRPRVHICDECIYFSLDIIKNPTPTTPAGETK